MASGYRERLRGAFEAPATYLTGTEMSTCKVLKSARWFGESKKKRSQTNSVSSQRFDSPDKSSFITAPAFSAELCSVRLMSFPSPIFLPFGFSTSTCTRFRGDETRFPRVITVITLQKMGAAESLRRVASSVARAWRCLG